MTAIVAVASLCDATPEVIVRDGVDVVELNHYYNENGKLVFSQYIFWEWIPWQSRHHVVDWRFAEVGQLRAGGFLFWDEKQGMVRRVDSISVRKSWTQNDREVDERKVLPLPSRRGLSKVSR